VSGCERDPFKIASDLACSENKTKLIMIKGLSGPIFPAIKINTPTGGANLQQQNNKRDLECPPGKR
jgi:hypothetical protein